MSTATRPEPLSAATHTRAPLVCVLVPHLVTDDPNLAWYYDFRQSRAEFRRAFAALGMDWRWQKVTLADHARVIARLARLAERRPLTVFNLCDGDEKNGVPGISIIHALERHGLRYTGSDAAFYDGTTSKIDMKRAFDRARVPTAAWEIVPRDGRGAAGILARLGAPLILKPAISAGSMGVTTKSVVRTANELRTQMATLREGYHGWDLTAGGVLAERFVVGREFTTFVVGHHDAPSKRVVYPPVERRFNPILPAEERFLSFDRLWGMYEVESPVNGEADEDLWQYAPVRRDEAARIREVSWAAYAACGGRGYGRIDLRQDAATGELVVLEVNAQCGLSEDELFTSIGAILKFAKRPYAHAVAAILAAARQRVRTAVRHAA
jgi:D-alanine-D-alanine ligase-like ATP-grasp enzyme